MKTFKDHINEEQGPCWDGYKQVGMKKKGNKMVPNCVPVGEARFFTDEDRDKYVSDETIFLRAHVEPLFADFRSFPTSCFSHRTPSAGHPRGAQKTQPLRLRTHMKT